MPAPRILFVKLSSLGDVVHHMPVIADVRGRWPGAHVAWAVEPPYAGLLGLHPGVSEPIPVNLRGARDRWYSVPEWRRLRAARRRIAASRWDYIVDAQGLLKSAWLTRDARGVRFGPDAKSARERGAARFYDVGIPVDRRMHAVQRNRSLSAQVFGYRIDGPARYGLEPPQSPPPWAPATRYVVMLHAASHAQKMWPEAYWAALGQRLAAEGYAVVLPAGSQRERTAAHRLVHDIPGASVAPASELPELAALLAHAWAVVGVDTGLTHLAVALGRPTIGIYCATEPAQTGLHGGEAVSLGRPRAPPSVNEVARALGLAAPPEA